MTFIDRIGHGRRYVGGTGWSLPATPDTDWCADCTQRAMFYVRDGRVRQHCGCGDGPMRPFRPIPITFTDAEKVGCQPYTGGTPATRPCAHCGKLFTTPGRGTKRRITCSDQCDQARRKAQRRLGRRKLDTIRTCTNRSCRREYTGRKDAPTTQCRTCRRREANLAYYHRRKLAEHEPRASDGSPTRSESAA